MAESPSLRKTYKYKLKPTPEQERQFEEVLWQCRRLYNTALEQRITLWKQRGISRTRYEQEAELKDLRAALPDYAAIHSHVLARCAGPARQDLSSLLPANTESRAGQTPGFPRFQGRGRFNCFTYKEYGNGARLDGPLDNGFLVLSKIGRIAVRWSRPLEARPKPSPSRGRRMAGMYVSPAPMCRCSHLPLTGTRQALIWGSSRLPRLPMAR